MYPTPDEIISYLDSEKPRAWRDGHYPWQFMFEILHGLDDYTGFYYNNPNIGQIYDRSDTDSEKRGSCVPASFEMAVEHLFPTPPRVWRSPNGLVRSEMYGGYSSKTIPRSTIGKVSYSGTNNPLGELIIGGIRYPINQPMLHDIFRCNPKRMMSIINNSSLGLTIASNLKLSKEICKMGFNEVEMPYNDFNPMVIERLTLVDKDIMNIKSSIAWFNGESGSLNFVMNHDNLAGPVFETKDIHTWNIVRSLLQGRTPILTYRYPRPDPKFNNNSDGFPIVTSYHYDEKYWYLNQEGDSDDFNPEYIPDDWPEMQGHAIVAIGLKKIGGELFFLINDPGPSLKMDIREGEFELLPPDDPKLKCGTQYWISENLLLRGRTSIDGLFEVSRDVKVLDESAEIHQVSEFRMGLKEKKKPFAPLRIVIL